MRKITVLAMLTLDGVMQGPGAPEEDPSNGFEFGGWVAPYDEEEYDSAVTKELEASVDYLLGRKTFEIWENYWPGHAEFWPQINEGVKYVLSETRRESNWNNTVFLKSITDIKALKHTEGKDIQVWGSTQLIQLLLAHDLVDELRLKIHPLTLGKGKKLFEGGEIPAAFLLKACTSTPKGVILANYLRAGKVETGTVGT
ncbi:dihydrofolate reductase family protein [Echinicola marina]|uniref:dihydrofolate reductase family protein n=1 Tax=Echinicola marina TaxID=2859768 RepID=UPI001CF6D608|nr:dihydrofolate reductase family protein [Echinicola marina]UCS91939.1 dihydrofolate reductase family protein [Echinicola marina]